MSREEKATYNVELVREGILLRQSDVRDDSLWTQLELLQRVDEERDDGSGDGRLCVGCNGVSELSTLDESREASVERSKHARVVRCGQCKLAEGNLQPPADRGESVLIELTRRRTEQRWDSRRVGSDQVSEPGLTIRRTVHVHLVVTADTRVVESVVESHSVLEDGGRLGGAVESVSLGDATDEVDLSPCHQRHIMARGCDEV